MATSLSSPDAEDIRFWRKLRPSLSIEGSGRTPAFELNNLDQQQSCLRFEGYVPRPGGIGYAGKEARRAAKAIAAELSGVPWPTVAPEVTIAG